MKAKLLTAQGEELSRLLGEIFEVIPEQLNLEPGEHLHDPNEMNICNKCKQYLTMNTPWCEFVDPIPLTPDNAFHWWKFSIGRFGVETYRDALISVIMPGEENAPNSVKLEMVLLAAETDHLKAAALCVLNEKEVG